MKTHQEAGFPATAEVEGEGKVVLSHLPPCRAAVVTHFGPYDERLDAYDHRGNPGRGPVPGRDRRPAPPSIAAPK